MEFQEGKPQSNPDEKENKKKDFPLQNKTGNQQVNCNIGISEKEERIGQNHDKTLPEPTRFATARISHPCEQEYHGKEENQVPSYPDG